ncbi:unnamed protein product [Closterium sp. NIES-53]
MEPETPPTLLWTGEVGDASVFQVWGSLTLVCDPTASKLVLHTICCVFLGFPTHAPHWHFYHPTTRHVLSSCDVTFDESVCCYRFYHHRSSPVPPPLPPPSSCSLICASGHPIPLGCALEVSSNPSGPAEGGEPAADDIAASRCSLRLETLLGIPPRPNSPPLQPDDVDPGVVGGGDSGGVGFGGAGSGGTDPEGAVSVVA